MATGTSVRAAVVLQRRRGFVRREMNYYNEWDPQAAAWLRELISERLIPRGLVDERSITEVKAKDLEGFTQCHFFAGIGGWPFALQLAGVDHRTPLWTGSPPCQPFSAAGKQLGQFDPRHLAPVFLDLISQCRPAIIFGEQVAPAIAKSWMCDLQAHLEGEDYAVGFAVLPACSVGAPHKRERLFFGTKLVVYADDEQQPTTEYRKGFADANRTSKTYSSVADTDSKRLQRERRNGNQERRERPNFRQTGLLDGTGPEDYETNPHHSFWSDTDWLGCRDGKFRPVEPGTFPLANGIPARVGRLRGYGNAIVPEVAAEFVRAFLAASDDAIKG